jgi:energy-coupling factor transporter transmembrane protein EcfT
MLSKTTPAVRLLCGILVLAAVSVSPAHGLPLAFVLPWLALCRPSWRRLGKALLFALAMFAPFAACAPFIADEPSVPLGMAWRGVLCVLVSVATCSAIAVSELPRALRFLPRPLAALVTQLVVQTTLLAAEARNISRALLLRGGGVRVLFAFPAVWLTRLLLKAERVGDAMELRGFE